MSKIPKNLSDKDMLKNWVEETSVEDTFLAAEQKAKQAAKGQAEFEPPAAFRQAGFHPALMQELGSCFSCACSSRRRARRILPIKSNARAKISSSRRSTGCKLTIVK